MLKSPQRDAAKAGKQSDAKSASKQCKLKSGTISIVPVRYALDDVDPKKELPCNPLPKSEHWHPPFKLTQSHYTLRQLRDGWLYVYSNNHKTLQEYQVSGIHLAPAQWGSGQPADTQAGKPYFQHSVQDTLFIAFAHQRWSQRLCEQMLSSVNARHKWMRQLNLSHYHTTMEHQHVADISLLGARVADISTTQAPVAPDAFSNTCTPLDNHHIPKKTSRASERFNLVAAKPAHKEATYIAQLNTQGKQTTQNAVFIALDDVLADTTDDFLLLFRDWMEKEIILKDEKNRQKLQMADIARSLGRVRLPEDKLPTMVKTDPSLQIDFENDLTEYLLLANQYNWGVTDEEVTQHTAQVLSKKSDPGASIFEIANRAFYRRFLEKNKKIKSYWKYQPTDNDKTLAKNIDKYEGEVRWDDLDKFLKEILKKLNGYDKKIENRCVEFLSTLHQLGLEPESFGIDNQQVNGQVYLVTLFYPFLMGLINVANSDAVKKQLRDELSLDDPKNLLALAPMGFSYNVAQALRSNTTNASNFLNVSSMLMLAGRIADWNSLIDNPNITQQNWFKALIEPTQNIIIAFRNAAIHSAGQMINSIFDLLFPIQSKPWNTPESIVYNLKFVYSKLITTPLKDGLKFSKNFQNEIEKTSETLQELYKERYDRFGIKHGKVVPVPADIQKSKGLILDGAIASVKTEGIILANNEYAQAARSAVIAKLNRVQNKATESWHNIEGLSGLIALLNVVNLSITLGSIKEIWQKDDSLAHWDFAAQLTATSSWTISAVADVFKNKSAKVVNTLITDETLKQPLLRFIGFSSEVIGQNLKDLVLRRFIKATMIFSLFGFVASVTEGLDSGRSAFDSSHSEGVRVLYGIKTFSLAADIGIFGVQSLNLFFKQGSTVLDTILNPAAWIGTTLFWAGVVYLVVTVLIYLFKRSDLQKWLAESYWGTNRESDWNFENAMRQLLAMIQTPKIACNPKLPLPSNIREELYKSNVKDGGYGLIKSNYHFQVTIDFSCLPQQTKEVGLKIICANKNNLNKSTEYYLKGKSLKDTSKVVDESKGKWQVIKQEKNNIDIYRYTIDFIGVQTATDNDIFLSNYISVWVAIPAYIDNEIEYIYYNSDFTITSYKSEQSKNMTKMDESGIKRLTNRQLPKFIPLRGISHGII
ncbi:T6SS effector BTH_I2691 family protein [Celerinatantimonas yamalensis]|uniref:T6SS effector BTH_I2691 family protein n=1 Tax=Celerinatantimonas yamalensis TaxID=559956 RepID=A0ABW9G6Q7_9GAMM